VTLSPRRIEELLASHGVEPRRGLGQNFVADPNTVRRIARLAAVGPGDRVVEVGPGLGSLTLALAETGAQIVAVEADARLVPLLCGVLAEAGVASSVRVETADALEADWGSLLEGTGWVLVANLPYNVAATVVIHVLDEVPAVGRLLVMVQREVGERLAATPGSSAWGIPSVKVAYHATARVVAAVPRSVFIPRPRVDSVLVEIRRRPEPATDAPPGPMFSLVRTAFGQRRKMLRRSLAGVVPPDAFAAAGIDPTRRPEELGVEDWGRLTRAWGGTGSPAASDGAGG
jgi:16S rRNA (adenine1518-N6/adenine1519-N6)-dimethyltransferase